MPIQVFLGIFGGWGGSGIMRSGCSGGGYTEGLLESMAGLLGEIPMGIEPRPLCDVMSYPR